MKGDPGAPWCPLEPRCVVLLASVRAQNPEAKDWLRKDERGFWERQARGYIGRTREKRIAEKIPDGVAASEIADRLLLDALQALLARARSESTRRPGKDVSKLRRK